MTAPGNTKPEQPILARLLWVRGLRAFADGFISLLLPLYLIELGMAPLQVGIIATGTLLGSGALTLLAGLHAWRFEYRSLLLLASLLMAATGAGFAALDTFWPLLLIAIIGTLNPSGGDVSIFLPLEHALLSSSVDDERRTAAFARYSLTGALLAALGALCAGLPQLLTIHIGLGNRTALQAMFALYAVLGIICALIYRGLPRHSPSGQQKTHPAPLRKSRKTVYILTSLFALDSFGGGFVLHSMLALWLFQKFHLSTAVAGSLFFWIGIFSALSHLVAVRIARRIGLVNTMVFTHLPSSILLIMTPLMPTLEWAITLLLMRSALSQMDVPVRSSYVMAVVPPPERPAAASVTAVPRSLAAAIGPVLAGYLLNLSDFGWPLIIAGILKIIYDLLLLILFGPVRPPEEQR